MTIRNETPADYRQVEELTRRAFWNLHSPGCDEHYLAHILRTHPDFVPELDLVIEQDGRLIANVMYAKSKLTNANGACKEVLTFGPVSVLPEVQRKGYGGKLLSHSFDKALALGYDTVVIFGNPENYICHGFQSSKKFNICVEDGIFPTALLVKELRKGAITAGKWTYIESDAYQVDSAAAEEYDKTFAPLAKGYQKSQELFYIYSHSQLL